MQAYKQNICTYHQLENAVIKVVTLELENQKPNNFYCKELLLSMAFEVQCVDQLLQDMLFDVDHLTAEEEDIQSYLRLGWKNFIIEGFRHFGQNEQTNNLVVSVYMLIYKLGYHSAALFKHLVKEFPEHTVQLLAMVTRAVIHYEQFQEQSKLNGRFEELKNETNPAANFQALDRNPKYVAYVAKNQKYFGEPDAKELFHTLPTFLDRCAINALASFFEMDREQDQVETIAFLKEVTKKETDQEVVEHFVLDLLRYPALMTVFHTVDLDKPGWKTEHVVLKLKIDGLVSGDVSDAEFLKYAKKHRFVAKLALDVAYNCLLAPKKLDQFAHVVDLLAKHSIGEEATKQALVKDFKFAEVPGVPELVQSLKAQDELHTVIQKPDAPPIEEAKAKSAKEEKQPETQTFEKMIDAMASDANCSQQTCDDYARIAVLHGLAFKDIARHAQLPSFPALLKSVLAAVMQTEYELLDKILLPEKYRCLPLSQLLRSDFAVSEEYLDNLKAARFGHHHEEDADPAQLHNHVDAFAVATVGRFFGASPKEIQKAGQRLHAVFKKESELQSVAHLLADELQVPVAMNAFSHLELDNSVFKAGYTMLESRLAKYLGKQIELEEFSGLASRPLTAAPVLDIVQKLTFAASLDGKLFLEVKSALVKAGCLDNESALAKMKEQAAANQTYGAMALVKKLAKFSKPGQPPKKAKQSARSREVSMKSEMQPEESSQPVQSEPQKDTQQPEEIKIQSSTLDMQYSKPAVQEQRNDTQKENISFGIKKDREGKDVQSEQIKVNHSRTQKDKQKGRKINSNSNKEENLTNPVSLSEPQLQLKDAYPQIQLETHINIGNSKLLPEYNGFQQEQQHNQQINAYHSFNDMFSTFNNNNFENPPGLELNSTNTFYFGNVEYVLQKIEFQNQISRERIFKNGFQVKNVVKGKYLVQELTAEVEKDFVGVLLAEQIWV
ncbi:Hypothetical_protein [Hexamita inflata]|uniref:Hypothetical_protein n=1 Tax=Hexamita inflata TaxID=28002 RepID=A0AA86QS41_9EUKA|nr:Hypothetical protein HINF_LOCUS50653 [Hexamita inflata]